MFADCSKYSADQIYFLMIQAIVPRPIAWVLSDNGNGSFNLAPFSFFNGVTSEPPLLMISVGRKFDGTRKDTWTNIEERREFVVHIPSGDQGTEVVASSVELPHGESEIKHLNLKTVFVEGLRLPRLEQAKAAFFCVRHSIHEIGEGPQALILGEIKAIWLDDQVVEQKNGRWIVDYGRLNPLARLGGNEYSLLGEKLTIRRPK